MVSNENYRNFNCKDEELPVICNYAAFSLERDLAAFTAFSPKFTAEYLTEFKNKNAIVADLVQPETETLAKKVITDRLYATIGGLIEPMNHLTAYLKLAKKELNISPTSFGLGKLRRSVNSKDAEGVMNNLQLVIANIENHKTVLTTQGLTEALILRLKTDLASIGADKQAQYELTRARAELVQKNLSKLNELFGMLTEFLSVGKTLFKSSDPVKAAEYTFSELKRKVRHIRMNKPDETNTAES